MKETTQTMGICELIDDIKTIIDLDPNPKIINKAKWDDLGLPQDMTACIRPENKIETIYILDELNEEERLQAEAHELAHKLLNSRGLVIIDTGDKDEDGYLKLSLNNAISHGQIKTILNNEYNISTDYQDKFDRIQLQSFEDWIEESKNDGDALLYGLGIALYAIERESIVEVNEINRIAGTNPMVLEALNSARQFLNDISETTSKEKQINILKNFVRKLGYTDNYLTFKENELK